MPRVAVPVAAIVRTGLAVPSETSGDATNNHTVVNNGRTFVLARNSGAGARTITFRVARSTDGLTRATRVVSLAAGVSRYFGPFPTDDWGSSLEVDVEHAEVKLSAFTL